MDVRALEAITPAILLERILVSVDCVSHSYAVSR